MCLTITGRDTLEILISDEAPLPYVAAKNIITEKIGYPDNLYTKFTDYTQCDGFMSLYRHYRYSRGYVSPKIMVIPRRIQGSSAWCVDEGYHSYIPGKHYSSENEKKFTGIFMVPKGSLCYSGVVGDIVSTRIVYLCSKSEWDSLGDKGIAELTAAVEKVDIDSPSAVSELHRAMEAARKKSSLANIGTFISRIFAS